MSHKSPNLSFPNSDQFPEGGVGLRAETTRCRSLLLLSVRKRKVNHVIMTHRNIKHETWRDVI